MTGKELIRLNLAMDLIARKIRYSKDVGDPGVRFDRGEAEQVLNDLHVFRADLLSSVSGSEQEKTNEESLLRATLHPSPTDALPHATIGVPGSWHPIETAPKDGTDVFVCAFDNGEPFVFIASYVTFDGDPPEGYHNGWCNHWDGAYLPEDEYELTHWMPLPAAPEAK